MGTIGIAIIFTFIIVLLSLIFIYHPDKSNLFKSSRISCSCLRISKRSDSSYKLSCVLLVKDKECTQTNCPLLNKVKTDTQHRLDKEILISNKSKGDMVWKQPE